MVRDGGNVRPRRRRDLAGGRAPEAVASEEMQTRLDQRLRRAFRGIGWGGDGHRCLLAQGAGIDQSVD
jgi:hypothetical protein